MEVESQVILKGDDRGNQEPIYRGIDSLVEQGLLTDVAVIIQYTGTRERDLLIEAVDRSPLRDEPGIGIELHVNLNTGKPISNAGNVPSLVDSQGIFRRPLRQTASAWRDYSGTVAPDEVRREINAQLERYFTIFGHYPHALDSHNIILAVPPGDEIAMEIALQLKIPLTVPKILTNKRMSGPWNMNSYKIDQNLLEEYKRRGIITADWEEVELWDRFQTLEGSVKRLTNALGTLRTGTTSFFFHPGHPDNLATVGKDFDQGRFERARVRDYQILTHPKVRETIQGLKLTSYKKLSAGPGSI